MIVGKTSLDAASSVVIGLSCVLGGSLLGISAFVFVKRLRTKQRRSLEQTQEGGGM
uniref:Uncharacterized protein n=1 Tax=Magallana gigas TaxID=29159 RepID=K1QJL1_MAGGI